MLLSLAVFILEDAISVWTNLGIVVRGPSCTSEDSSRSIMPHVPVFILETNNRQTNNEYFLKCVQTNSRSSSIKTAIEYSGHEFYQDCSHL